MSSADNSSIEALRQDAQALQDGEARFRSLFENSLDATFLGLPDGTITAANPAACAMFGMSQEELCRVGRTGLADPADPGHAAAWAERARTGKAKAEVTFVRKDGTRFPGEISSVLVPGDQPQVIVTLRDISRRQAAEQAVRENEQKYRSLFERNPDGVFALDVTGRFTMANPACAVISGYSMDELLGKTFAELCAADQLEATMRRFQRGFNGEPPENLNTAIIRKDGRRVDLLVTGGPVVVDGKVVALHCAAKDITAHEQAERTLRESEARFRLLAENAQDVIFRCEVEPHPHYTYISPALTALSGYTPEEIYADPGLVLRAVHPDDRAALQTLLQQRLPSPPTVIRRYIHKDGHVIWTEEHSTPIYDGAGKLVAMEGIVRDITERRQSQEQAEAANQAKDQFLAVLSHELRTPLTAVLATAQMMATDQTLSPLQREQVEMIHRNAEMEARLIDDLLDLTRISRGKVELYLGPVDLHATLWHVVQICESDIHAKQLKLAVELNAADHLVQADAIRLHQILWNLLKNAVKFTPPGGQITLGTAHPRPGQICLTVTDTGIGIEPEILPRLFTAFEQGEKAVTRQFGGLGLGLAVSKGLVDLHGGSLSAQSDGKGKGATFTLLLPTRDGSAPATVSQALQTSQRLNGGGRRILLVEDHADTAKAMARLLERFGFDVWTADTVASALQATEAEHFDLLISDIGLPDGSGHDLMRQLAGQHPIKGIALSGFGMDEDIRQSREAGFAAHLTKPLNLQKLQEIIRQVLA